MLAASDTGGWSVMDWLKEATRAIFRHDSGRLATLLSTKAPEEDHLHLLLTHALKENSPVAVKLLVESQPAIVREGDPPILIAAKCGSHKPVIDVLVDAGFDINARQIHLGKTPLMLASQFGLVETVEALLTRPECECDAKSHVKMAACRTDQSNHGLVALLVAVMVDDCLQRAALVETFLQHGANPNIIACTSFVCHVTPLMLAAILGYADTVQLLIDAGVEIDAKDPIGDQTALHWAVEGVNMRKNRNVNVLKPLIAAGAKLNAVSSSCYAHNCVTPLLRACDIGYFHSSGEIAQEMASILIKAGSDVNKRDMYGKTILHRVVNRGWLDIIDMVMDNADNETISGFSGHSIIYSVVGSHQPNLDGLKKLLDRNWDVRRNVLQDLELYKIQIPLSSLMNTAMHQGNVKLLPYLLAAGSALPIEVDRYKNWAFIEDHIFAWLKRVTSQPRTLMEFCRIAIRQTLPLACHLETVVSDLPIPREMMDYILLRTWVDSF